MNKINNSGIQRLQTELVACTTEQEFLDQRSKWYKQGIKTTYDDSRVIFSTTRYVKNYIPFFPGTVLERGTGKLLTLLPYLQRRIRNVKQLNQHLDDYTVYKARDGTMVSLYYYDSQWVMSTNSGLSMNNMKWRNQLSYQEMFCQALYDSLEYTFEQFTSLLDQSTIYCFGFTHEWMHPFAKSRAVWFVQSVNRDTLEYNLNLSKVLPDIPSYMNVEEQEIIERPKNVQELFNKVVLTLDQYCNGVESESPFGYILVNGQTRIYIISRLMKFIKDSWYDRRLHSDKDLVGTAVINAIVNGNQQTFTKLFGYQDKVDYYTSAINKVIECMCNDDSEYSENIRELSKLMRKFFVGVYKYTVDDKPEDVKRKHYTKFVYHRNSMYLLFDLIE